MAASDKFLWTCELNKDEPTKVWKATDLMEFEDEDDKDFVINSLMFKTAVLGAKAVDNERNLVAIRTKGHLGKEFEQPIFSLTLGRQDMVSGMDLVLGSDHEVEFKLIAGTGPVFITCMHLIEMPHSEEQHTLMTTSDGEDLECGDDEAEEVEDEDKAANGNKRASLKNGHGLKNGKAINGNGAHNKEEIEVDEK
jgi:hypothetical protein